MERTELTSITRGLDRALYPYRLWRKAKTLGTWDPDAIDYAQDRRDWDTLTNADRTVVLYLSTRFMGGEESVLHDLLPLMLYVSREGCVEEEMFLAAFQFEEAKHLDAFSTYFAEVVQSPPVAEYANGDAYRSMYHDVLPKALNRLLHDPSPEALADAVVTYQMISEGTLAETGYHVYHQLLEKKGIMPGLQEMIRMIQRDEARHVAFGVYLLSRLVVEHGERMWSMVEGRMAELGRQANQVMLEGINTLNHLQFLVDVDAFRVINFGYTQFLKRLNRIEKARRQTLDEVRYGRYADDPVQPAALSVS